MEANVTKSIGLVSCLRSFTHITAQLEKRVIAGDLLVYDLDPGLLLEYKKLGKKNDACITWQIEADSLDLARCTLSLCIVKHDEAATEISTICVENVADGEWSFSSENFKGVRTKLFGTKRDPIDKYKYRYIKKAGKDTTEAYSPHNINADGFAIVLDDMVKIFNAHK